MRDVSVRADNKILKMINKKNIHIYIKTIMHGWDKKPCSNYWTTKKN